MWDITVESFLSNSEKTLEYISNNWENIKMIRNLSDIEEGGLFKFRGMIQDMFNIEYFYSSYEVVNTQTEVKCVRSGLYRDAMEFDPDVEELDLDSAQSITNSRKPYYCITIPGMNDWAQINQNIQHSVPIETPVPLPEKRCIEDMETNDEHDNKRYKTENGHGSINPTCLTKSYPISCPNNMGIVIVFDESIEHSLKVTDTLEVVGFVYRNTMSSHESITRDVPRLYVVKHKPVLSTSPLDSFLKNPDCIIQEAKVLRSELHGMLTQVFLGDSLTADFFICHLLARVYKRHDCLALGKLSMNIFNLPKLDGLSFSNQLYNIISKLVPKSHLFPMNLSNMNTTEMTPKKDYDTDRLHAGLLQLSHRTCLVIDETELGVGKLESKGVLNVKALSNLIIHQKLEYDFTYYNMDFDTDINILSLSEGKSVLPSDCRISLKPECTASLGYFDLICDKLREPLLSKLRTYIFAASMFEFKIPDELLPIIEEDIVKMRQISNLTQDEMHILLIIARWMSLSYGETTLTKEMWDKVCRMDIDRRERMSA